MSNVYKKCKRICSHINIGIDIVIQIYIFFITLNNSF